MAANAENAVDNFIVTNMWFVVDAIDSTFLVTAALTTGEEDAFAQPGHGCPCQLSTFKRMIHTATLKIDEDRFPYTLDYT